MSVSKADPKVRPAVVDELLPSTDLFVGGEWRPSESGDRLPVIDPATEEVIVEVVGPGLAPGVALGPLVNEAQPSSMAELVGEATGNGARVVVGGTALDRRGYFYAPTVLGEVPASAGILGEEVFGPVAPVVVFDDEEEAVSLANDTEMGLAAYVMTGDLARGLRVAEQLECGMVGLNRCLLSDPAAPFGGTKQSGLGREGARHGIAEFLEPKYVAVSW